MEYSVFGAVRGQYENCNEWVGEPLGYKYPPITVQMIMKYRAKPTALIFVPLLRPLPFPRELRLSLLELL